MTSMKFIDPIGPTTSQLSDALDILLITLGRRCFGLPLLKVRQIYPMPPDFPCYDASMENHFVFQGNPLPYISLWNLLDLKSEYAEYEEIQAMLMLRRQDHLDWMDALQEAILYNTPFSKARNPRECAFGKWYYGYHTSDLQLSLLMRHFEQPHNEIHRLADKLLGLVETGQVNDALRAFHESKNTTLAELLELFDSTQELVVKLQRRIVIIVVDGDDACALGADSVRDIVVVPAERIKPSTAIGTPATSALIVLDDQTVVPLIDWHTFFADREMQRAICVSQCISKDRTLRSKS